MDVENSLLGVMGREELEEEVARRVEKFHGLLTREAALRLLAKEKGLLKAAAHPIGSISQGQDRLSVSGRVRKVWHAARYASGKRSRAVEIDDGSGSITLVLWNSEADRGKILMRGDRVTVSGAYEKGGELHLGYSGSISIDGRAGLTPLDRLQDGEYSHVRGKVTATEGGDRFVRGCAPTRRGYSFFISDGRKELRCVIWEGRDRGASLRQGDEVILESALFNAGELGISGEGRILRRKR